ncbi:MAG TPA: nucleoside diphosphate kinase regulator [Gammaproteobacteria bacterium]|nr:nucleoside diphosphate kinase regulator [Gammaproteobacteria bacterium]
MKEMNAAVRQPAKPSLIIDEGHYERLVALATRAMREAPGLAANLLDEVERAELRPSRLMPPDVVTIGSMVTFRDEDDGREETVQLVLPPDADIDRRRVSVLTPVGAALLGLSVGQAIEWEVAPGRVRHIRVVGVVPPAKPVVGADH